ncbi:MAG TPA: transposase [Campylobacterales bacterium]|nr:transposase [Campylobacterales bacterium]
MSNCNVFSHSCRAINHKINNNLEELKNRVFKCESCSLILDKDYNASLNIQRVGASTLCIENVRAALAMGSVSISTTSNSILISTCKVVPIKTNHRVVFIIT